VDDGMAVDTGSEDGTVIWDILIWAGLISILYYIGRHIFDD